MTNQEFSNNVIVWICAASSVIIFSLWYRLFLKQLKNVIKPGIDFGLFWLAMTMVVWAIEVSLPGDVSASKWGDISSSLNNLCFLLAISYLDHAHKFILILAKNKRNFRIISCVLCMASFISTYFIRSADLANLPDLILSAITVLLLAYAFFLTFKNRNLTVLSLLSIFVLLLLYLEQPIDAQHVILDKFFIINEDADRVLGLFSRLMFSVLVCVLALSWYIEKYTTLEQHYDNAQEEIIALSEDKEDIYEKVNSQVLNKIYSIRNAEKFYEHIRKNDNQLYLWLESELSSLYSIADSIASEKSENKPENEQV